LSWHDTLWLEGTFHSNLWTDYGTLISELRLLGRILTVMEQTNVGDSYWDRGLWEDGMWEHDTIMIKLRQQMEKH
jgi:hypothetical protein